MRDDLPTGSTTEFGREEAQAAELSRAAREAVRHPADPRIDRQLARMGLAPSEGDETADAAVRGGVDRGPARPVRVDELDPLRASLTATEAALDRVTRRLDTVRWIVVMEAVAIGILAVLVLLR